MGILVVEFPKEKVEPPPKPKGVFDVHPRPWHLGESKTNTTEILDANYKHIGTIQHGGILGGHKDTPKKIVDLINATA